MVSEGLFIPSLMLKKQYNQKARNEEKFVNAQCGIQSTNIIIQNFLNLKLRPVSVHQPLIHCVIWHETIELCCGGNK